MYCHKCNRLLSEDNLVCTKCGFDNSKLESHKLKESIVKENKKLSKNIIITGIIILILLFSIPTLILLKKDNNISIETNIPNIEKLDLNHSMNYKDITINYPDTWGSNRTTIFNRDNAKINITFHEIDEKEYNETISINECLKHSFQDIEALTYAEEKSYAYIFEINNIYYKLIVNNDNQNNNITNEISQIINSIHKKR